MWVIAHLTSDSKLEKLLREIEIMSLLLLQEARLTVKSEQRNKWNKRKEISVNIYEINKGENIHLAMRYVK